MSPRGSLIRLAAVEPPWPGRRPPLDTGRPAALAEPEVPGPGGHTLHRSIRVFSATPGVGEPASLSQGVARARMAPRGTSRSARGLGVAMEGVKTRALRELERLNIEARHPDALPDAIPAEYFTAQDAEEAIIVAADVVAAARSFLG